MIEIDFAQLNRDGLLETFIRDLHDLSGRQQEVMNKYKDREFLAPMIVELQKKVDRWHLLIETGVAFKKSFQGAQAQP